MNILPKVLEDIIMSHKKFLDHQERNKNILKDIKTIHFRVDEHGDSWRNTCWLNGKRVQCYAGLNRANNYMNSVYEVWIHRHTMDDNENEFEMVKVIFEEYQGVDIIEN
jgi:hypothetical protein